MPFVSDTQHKNKRSMLHPDRDRRNSTTGGMGFRTLWTYLSPVRGM
jgi:hypothetical protein